MPRRGIYVKTKRYPLMGTGRDGPAYRTKWENALNYAAPDDSLFLDLPELFFSALILWHPYRTGPCTGPEGVVRGLYGNWFRKTCGSVRRRCAPPGSVFCTAVVSSLLFDVKSHSNIKFPKGICKGDVVMKKMLYLFLVFALVISSVAGCAPAAEEPAPPAEEPGAETPEEPAQEPLKVAALLPGPISDMGWNATAYNGLLAIEEQFGCEISYVENVASSDTEEVFRSYATQGYDVIFGHGFEFGDAALRVAPDFPDTQFVIVSSNISEGANLGSVNFAAPQQGFLAGALAALVSETGVVGAIGGKDMPPIRMPILGFMAGAEYVNPDIEVKAVMTGSNEDVAGLKETALAMLDANADVIFALADQAGMGSIEACTEKGALSIGANVDQNELAPDTVMQSVEKDARVLFTFIIGQILDGTYEASFHELGVAEDAIYLSDWHGFDAKYPEAKAEIEKIIAGIADGSIVIDISNYEV